MRINVVLSPPPQPSPARGEGYQSKHFFQAAYKTLPRKGGGSFCHPRSPCHSRAGGNPEPAGVFAPCDAVHVRAVRQRAGQQREKGAGRGGLHQECRRASWPQTDPPAAGPSPALRKIGFCPYRSLQNSQFCHSRDASGRESILQLAEIMDARQKHSGMTKRFAIASLFILFS
jgi:hypothetical protein